MTTLSLAPGSLIVQIRRLLESRTLFRFSPSKNSPSPPPHPPPPPDEYRHKSDRPKNLLFFKLCNGGSLKPCSLNCQVG